MSLFTLVNDVCDVVVLRRNVGARVSTPAPWYSRYPSKCNQSGLFGEGQKKLHLLGILHLLGSQSHTNR